MSYSAASRTASLLEPDDEDVFIALRVFYVVVFSLSLLFLLLLMFLFLVYIFVLFCLFCVPSWRRCPLLATFLSVFFYLLSLPFSPRFPGLI